MYTLIVALLPVKLCKELQASVRMLIVKTYGNAEKTKQNKTVATKNNTDRSDVNHP